LPKRTKSSRRCRCPGCKCSTRSSQHRGRDLMIRRFLAVVCLLALASAAVAQETSDLERRLRALQDKVNEVEELKREIDVLSKEIEALKTGQQKQSVEVTPALSGRQYGLGAAASKVYRAEPGFSIGGYG